MDLAPLRAQPPLGRILVVNVGSSSLKLNVVDDSDRVVTWQRLAVDGGRLPQASLRRFVERCPPIDAVGHRIVHGGTSFATPVLVDPGVRRRLGELCDLAPLHQPLGLQALDTVRDTLPDTPAIACFDTAFHAGMPAAASTYALPREWRHRWQVKRYGFHGLSHAYASRRVAALAGEEVGALRIVTCHLGAGASLAAVHAGASVDTTMGFTPLEGLVMATRSGTVDPGLVLWLIENAHLAPAEVAATLEHGSGLVGLAGTADVRAVLAAADGGDVDAVVAVDVYLHRLRAGIAAMAAAMGGLDVLVFTGGVGEASATIRRRATEGLAFLGVAVDREVNDAAVPDAELTAPGASVRTFVVVAREDLEIARGVRTVLGGVR